MPWLKSVRRATRDFAIEEEPNKPWHPHPPCPMCGRSSSIGRAIALRETYHCSVCEVDYCPDGAVYTITEDGDLEVVRHSKRTIEEKRRHSEVAARKLNAKTKVEVAIELLPKAKFKQLIKKGMTDPQVAQVTGVRLYLVKKLKAEYGLVKRGRPKKGGSRVLMGGGRGWTEQEEDYIRDNYRTMTDAELAANMPGRTERGVDQHRVIMKLLRRKAPTPFIDNDRRRRIPAHIRDGLFGGSDSSWGREI